MEIDRPLANDTATGIIERYLPRSPEQCTHQNNGGPHFAHILMGKCMARDLSGVDRQTVACLFHKTANALKQSDHAMHIRDIRTIL